MPSPTLLSVSSVPASLKPPAELAKSAAAPLSTAALGVRYLAFVAVAVIGCAVDLLTKHYIFAWRGFPGRWLLSVTPCSSCFRFFS